MVNKRDKLMTDDRVSLKPDGYQPVCVPSNQAPTGAVRMTQHEVITMQQEKVNQAPWEEKYWLGFSQYITMGSSIISAALINSHFRRKFHIRYYGAMSTVPVLLIPSVFARAMDYFLTQRVLLLPECQGCLEVKSGVINSMATVLPTLCLSASVSVYLAKKHHTYVISSNFQPVIQRVVKSTRSNFLSLAAIAAISFGIGAINRHKQRQEIDAMMEKEAVAVKRLLEQME